METFQDGAHILRLRYELEAVEAAIHTWNVVLSSEGAAVSIERYGVLGVVSGMGLAGNGEWDGEITAEDVIDRFFISRIMNRFSDTADVRLLHDTPCLVTDGVFGINVASILSGFAEKVEPTSDVMVFSPWANADKVTTSCEVKDNGWSGSGSTTLKTSLSLTTCAVSGAAHLTADSKNAIFYISFDNSSSWVGEDGHRVCICLGFFHFTGKRNDRFPGSYQRHRRRRSPEAILWRIREHNGCQRHSDSLFHILSILTSNLYITTR